jgi:hypothetical protein
VSDPVAAEVLMVFMPPCGTVLRDGVDGVDDEKERTKRAKRWKRGECGIPQ